MLTINRFAVIACIYRVYVFLCDSVETTTFLLVPQAGDIDQSTEKPIVTFFVQK